MSLPNLIATLLSGIRDPATRLDVATTINYLCDLYASRGISDDELEKALHEIVRDVLTATMIKASKEERSKRVEDMVFEFMKAIKLTALSRRAMSQYRIPVP